MRSLAADLNIVKIHRYDGRMSSSISGTRHARARTPDDATPKRPYHHGDLEQALIRTATEHIDRFGAHDVSLRKVAQAVGTSPSAAYSHFPDKSALLLAAAQVGVNELDARMLASTEQITGDDEVGAIARFWSAGDAYIQFALDRPHMFRHIFGPICAQFKGFHDDHGAMEHESISYDVLCRALDDLETHGLLRPGTREGLDLVAWTMVHGFASLVLDGFMSADVAREQLLPAFGRLALVDRAAALDPSGGPTTDSSA